MAFWLELLFVLNMDQLQIWPHLGLFSSFSDPNSNYSSVDGVLRIWTWGAAGWEARTRNHLAMASLYFSLGLFNVSPAGTFILRLQGCGGSGSLSDRISIRARQSTAKKRCQKLMIGPLFRTSNEFPRLRPRLETKFNGKRSLDVAVQIVWIKKRLSCMHHSLLWGQYKALDFAIILLLGWSGKIRQCFHLYILRAF